VRTHWFGEDVNRIDTTLAELPRILPTFERRAFGRNRLHDVIARAPGRGREALPVGLVSKKYVLVQHAEVIAALTREVGDAGINPAKVQARAMLTEYGTRIAVRATLPPEYSITPEDGHCMALTYECFNSVDGSVPLFAAVGWFRFVCANGMIVGTPTAKVRVKHLPPLQIDEVSEVLAAGVRAATDDRASFARWQSTRVSDDDFERFVDEAVATAWGPMAAARVYGIATAGLDGRPAPPSRRAPPHAWTIREGHPVPGTHAPCADAYQVSQVLAWVASRRNNVAKRLEWRDEIGALMSQLAPA
jgi:hypothetical protein